MQQVRAQKTRTQQSGTRLCRTRGERRRPPLAPGMCTKEMSWAGSNTRAGIPALSPQCQTFVQRKLCGADVVRPGPSASSVQPVSPGTRCRKQRTSRRSSVDKTSSRPTEPARAAPGESAKTPQRPPCAKTACRQCRGSRRGCERGCRRWMAPGQQQRLSHVAHGTLQISSVRV